VLNLTYHVKKKAVIAKEELFLPFMNLLKKKVLLKKTVLLILETLKPNAQVISLPAKNISSMTIALSVVKKVLKEKF